MGGPYSDTHDICPCFFNTHIPWVVSTMFYLDATCNLLAEMIQFDWCSFTLRKKPTRFRDMYHGQYVHIFLYLSLCIVQCRYVSQPCWIQSWFRYISAESIAHDQIIITLQVGRSVGRGFGEKGGCWLISPIYKQPTDKPGEIFQDCWWKKRRITWDGYTL